MSFPGSLASRSFWTFEHCSERNFRCHPLVEVRRPIRCGRSSTSTERGGSRLGCSREEEKSQMNRFVSTLAVVSAFGVAGVGFAAEKKTEGNGSGHRRGSEAVFKKMDKDGDGKVTLEEFKAFREAMHAKVKESGKSKVGRKNRTRL